MSEERKVQVPDRVREFDPDTSFRDKNSMLKSAIRIPTRDSSTSSQEIVKVPDDYNRAR